LRSGILYDDGTSLESSITRLRRGESTKLVGRASPNIKSAVATERLVVLFAEVNALSMLPVAEWELTSPEGDERTAHLSTPIAVSILESAVRSFAISLSNPR
jgi:hypothetical protein